MPLEVQTFPSGRYVTGGVGANEQAEMEQLRPQYNLRIPTARKWNANPCRRAGQQKPRGFAAMFQGLMTGYRVVVAAEGREYGRSVSIGASDPLIETNS